MYCCRVVEEIPEISRNCITLLQRSTSFGRYQGTLYPYCCSCYLHVIMCWTGSASMDVKSNFSCANEKHSWHYCVMDVMSPCIRWRCKLHWSYSFDDSYPFPWRCWVDKNASAVLRQLCWTCLWNNDTRFDIRPKTQVDLHVLMLNFKVYFGGNVLLLKMVEQ